jgi:hypothetical protein
MSLCEGQWYRLGCRDERKTKLMNFGVGLSLGSDNDAASRTHL